MKKIVTFALALMLLLSACAAPTRSGKPISPSMSSAAPSSALPSQSTKPPETSEATSPAPVHELDFGTPVSFIWNNVTFINTLPNFLTLEETDVFLSEAGVLRFPPKAVGDQQITYIIDILEYNADGLLYNREYRYSNSHPLSDYAASLIQYSERVTFVITLRYGERIATETVLSIDHHTRSQTPEGEWVQNYYVHVTHSMYQETQRAFLALIYEADGKLREGRMMGLHSFAFYGEEHKLTAPEDGRLEIIDTTSLRLDENGIGAIIPNIYGAGSYQSRLEVMIVASEAEGDLEFTLYEKPEVWETNEIASWKSSERRWDYNRLGGEGNFIGYEAFNKGTNPGFSRYCDVNGTSYDLPYINGYKTDAWPNIVVADDLALEQSEWNLVMW